MQNSTWNTFSFIPHVCYFSYHPWIAASEGQSLTTQENQHPCPTLLKLRHSSPPFCKNHKNLRLIWKFKQENHIDRELCIFLVRCSKQSVSCLLTLNCSEHFIRWGCFQICSGNNNVSLLLYASEVIHLINKGVISHYVQE